MPPVDAPVLELADPLAEFLGALAPGDRFRYTYEDVVKLAGHSCPTVAGAYLMTAAALRTLYGSDTPVRGEIEVTMGGDPSDGSAGPMSQVIAFITGAAPETGFLGLMGRWRRASLLRFDPSLDGRVRFRRADTGHTIEVSYDPSAVPPSPDMARLLPPALNGEATAEQRKRFADLWQARVADILTGDAARVIEIHDHGRRGARQGASGPSDGA